MDKIKWGDKMKNTIIDYIELRGDLLLLTHPFNEIDYLILSEITYIDFHEFLDFKTQYQYTIKQAYNLYLSKNIDISHKQFLRMYTLFKLMAEAPRYKNIRIIYSINEIDKDKIKQFSYLAYLLEDETMVISFKGTDETLVGWHEDFLMLCNDHIHAQLSAKKHLNKLSTYPFELPLSDCLVNRYLGKHMHQRIKKYFLYKKRRPIILTGHSKGGNLAMYASIFCDKEVQNRIIKVYNFDGPGFNDTIIQSENYHNIKDRIITYVPHYSIFGLLFNHKEERKVVRSVTSYLKQHDGITWEVYRDGFKEDELSLESQLTVQRFNQVLDNLSLTQKQLFIKDLFHTFDKLEFQHINDLSKVSFKHIINAIKELTSIDAKSRKTIIDVMTILFEESQKIRKDE